MTLVAFAIGCAWPVSAPAPAPEPPTVRADGVRVAVGAVDVRLETPVRRLSGEGRAPVVLVGAVHVGDPAYYAGLGELLAGCPTVLQEGLAPEEGAPAPDAGLGPLLARHGLVRQGEVLEPGEGWETADLSVAEVRQALLTAGASPELAAGWLDDRDQGELVRMLSSAIDDPRGSALVRLALLRGLAEPSPTEGPEAALYWDVVIGLRDRALAERAAEAASGAASGADPVCVIYGADHLADIEARLVRLGWARADEGWRTAIAVPFAALELGPAQVRQLLAP